jgi:membrane associated rhomboid family serine protease
MNFGNQYRPSGFGYLPTVTRNLLIINVALYALTVIGRMSGKFDLDYYLGLHHHLAPNFQPYQFITYMFMHQTIDEQGHIAFAHIFFNMFAVYMFGQLLERLWGPKRYLIFYMVCGLGAGITQYLLLNYEVSHLLDAMNAEIGTTRDAAAQAELINRKDMVIEGLSHASIIGASGSIFGLLGAFGMLFPNQYLYVYFLFPIKAKWFVIIYGGLELVLGVSGSNDNVGHFAHLGGLFVGIILVLLWRRDRRTFN